MLPNNNVSSNSFFSPIFSPLLSPIRLGDWQTIGQKAMPLRYAVFVDEQHVPKELEHDDADLVALHALMLDATDKPVATGRLLPAESWQSQIGRMAVAAPYRQHGLGSNILRTLMTAAQARGDKAVVLHAQLTAVGFYQRFGFVEQGMPFVDAGIAHVVMCNTLKNQ